MRLEYQNAEASQYASPIALHEKEPMVAAAKMALWDTVNASVKGWNLPDYETMSTQVNISDLHQ